MWFYEDWKDTMNPLLSMHDLFVTDKGIFEELQQGFQEHLRLFMKRSLDHVKRLYDGPAGEPYRWYWDRYLAYLDPEQASQFTGVLLLDSGGFVLGNPRSWVRMKAVRNGRGSEVADLMSKLSELEHSRGSHAQLLELGQEAQRIVLETGWAVKPDIIVTLDRVIHFEAPQEQKELYIQYNVSNAIAALRLKTELAKQAGGKVPMLWPVLHPWGPSLSDIKSGRITSQQAIEQYYRGYAQQLDALLAEEIRLGARFDGFGLGSLVPIADAQFLDIVGSAAQRALRERNLHTRPLHAFGSTEPKARKLHEYGISSFDSTHHTVRARNRQALYPDEGYYHRVSKQLVCSCRVCAKHRTAELDELLEDRKGVKEVATVLLALHNLEVSRSIHLEPMVEFEQAHY